MKPAGMPLWTGFSALVASLSSGIKLPTERAGDPDLPPTRQESQLFPNSPRRRVWGGDLAALKLTLR